MIICIPNKHPSDVEAAGLEPQFAQGGTQCLLFPIQTSLDFEVSGKEIELPLVETDGYWRKCSDQ